MVIRTVKKKVPYSAIFSSLAILTFVGSWTNVFPAQWVENAYARGAFPTISHFFAIMAGALSVSWLDVWIVVTFVILIYGVARRRWRLLLATTSVFYLWFFWGWGLNYHRLPLARRLQIDPIQVSAVDQDRFVDEAAQEINQLWPVASAQPPLSRDSASELAVQRVDRVIHAIDGIDWSTTIRVKRSVLGQFWYERAGIDGMFNPFGHEPLVIDGPLSFELPFLMSHEISHVRGVANEGEANLIALLATVESNDARFRYSGWLYLWTYLQAPVSKLDAGPRADLRAIRERLLKHQIQSVTRFQTTLLDAHLKANAVPGGIRSYSDFVSLAIASRSRWKEFE